MKGTFSRGTLILTLLFGLVVSKKHKVGPCLVVTEPEPCPDLEYIKVYLYTRKNTDNEQHVEFSKGNDSLASTHFNPKHPNKIIIHGFNTDMYLDVLQNMKSEYLKMGDVNVFMVNYPKLVHGGWCYISASLNIHHVGKCLVQLVEALRRHDSHKIHVIGFSLGAQVTNFMAVNLKGKKLDRITGLDPAGPAFTMMGKNNRLDSTDADFVDVVHTNGGIQGDIQKCGHVDFYMNGGVTQPGCFHNTRDALNCNHRRAPIYFTESINTKVGFHGWKCKSYVAYVEGKCKENTDLALMGEHCPIGSSGTVIVHTSPEKPFALGEDAAKLQKEKSKHERETEIPSWMHSLLEDSIF